MTTRKKTRRFSSVAAVTAVAVMIGWLVCCCLFPHCHHRYPLFRAYFRRDPICTPTYLSRCPHAIITHRETSSEFSEKGIRGKNCSYSVCECECVFVDSIKEIGSVEREHQHVIHSIIPNVSKHCLQEDIVRIVLFREQEKVDEKIVVGVFLITKGSVLIAYSVVV